MEPYLLYAGGILLLTLPSGPLIRKYFKTLTLSKLSEVPGGRLGLIHPLKALDMARAFAGATLINAAFAAIHPTGPQQLPARLVLLIATTAGLLVQHGLHRTKDETMHAPLAYLAGLALAILPLKVALFALPIGILSGIGLRHLSWGFIMTAIAVGSFGFLFRQSLLTLATACFLLMLPIVLSRLVHRPLVVAVRSKLVQVKPAGYGPIR